MAESRNLGRYELLRILGKGAMGVVYEGLDPTLGRRVAVKTILTSIALDPDVERSYAARFTQEANAVARLNHPNIVQVYDFGVEGDVAYLVMEFIEGRELRSIIDDDERLGIDEIVRIMYELLDALDFAHEAGVIHRDVKPANVMLDARRRAKLAHFGVARIQDGGQRTQADTMVGSPAFMSPEQIAGVKIDRRTEIFSAGVILYQLLCGEKPFKGEGPWAVMAAISNDSAAAPSLVRPGIPPVFDAIVARSLAKQPEYRFATAREFAAALRTAIGGGIVMPAPKDDDRRTRHTSDAELEFWRAIQGTGDPAELETYIDRFPDGTYSKLAKVKLSRLRDARKPDGTVATSAADAATLVVEHRAATAQSPPKKKRLTGTVALVVAGAIGLLGTALWLKGPLAPSPANPDGPGTASTAPASAIDLAKVQRETEERVRKEFVDKAANEQAAKDKAAAEEAAAKAAADRTAQAHLAADQARQAKAAAADRSAAEKAVAKAVAEKIATEKMAVQAAGEKLAAEKAATQAAEDKRAAEKATTAALVERAAAEKATKDLATARAAADRANLKANADRRGADTSRLAMAAAVVPDSRMYANEDMDWGIEPPSAPRARTLHGPTPRTIPGARVITTLALKGQLDSDKSVIVVDVLDSKTRTTIPGAYWMPGAGLGQFYGAETRAFAAALDKLSGGNKNRPLVFLCVSAECWLSYNASLRAVQVGYRNVAWFRGGTDAWTGAGFARKNPERID